MTLLVAPRFQRSVMTVELLDALPSFVLRSLVLRFVVRKHAKTDDDERDAGAARDPKRTIAHVSTAPSIAVRVESRTEA